MLPQILLCTATDDQKWIVNTKRQHSVASESRIMVLFLCKNVGDVTILLLYTLSDDALYLYQVSKKKNSKDFKVIDRRLFPN